MSFSYNFYKSDKFILKYLARFIFKKLSNINSSFDTSQFVLVNNDYVSNDILIDGFYEGKELKILCEWLKKKKKLNLVIDVGAYLGNHAVFFSTYFKNVISFEPNSFSYKLLDINTLKRKNIKIFNFGLSNKNSIKNFYSYENNYGGSSTRKNKNINYTKTKAKFKKFDNLKFNKKADLVKIDVEGDELKVLEGMSKYIDRYKPIIVFECQEEEIFNGTSKVIKYLKKKNYQNFYSVENYLKNDVSFIDKFFFILKYIFLVRKKYIVKNQFFKKKFYNFIIAEFK
jgi:FkbM family methyltransferase